MSDKTNIEWCDSTFNPWMGCTKVSPACDHCYAERDTSRFKTVVWGAGQERKRTSASNWKLPIKWNAEPFYQCECGWRGHDASTAGTGLTDGMPSCPVCDSLNLKEARRRVFCASLADVFDNEVPEQWRYDLWQLIHATPNLDWLLLTKRIGNAKQPEVYRNLSWPRNVWLGATICNQQEADRDIRKLLSVPVTVRFLSMEPLLGPVDLSQWLDIIQYEDGAPWGRRNIGHLHDMLDWVIVGGESGPAARPMNPQWVRDLRDQCQAAGVPFLFKQWGEWASAGLGRDGDPGQFAIHWPHDDGQWFMHENYPRQFTMFGSDALMKRVGKRNAGRLLDGRTHDGYPGEGHE